MSQTPSSSTPETESTEPRTAVADSHHHPLGSGSARWEQKLAELDPWTENWVRPDVRYLKLSLLNTLIWGVFWVVLTAVPLLLRLAGVWSWPWMWLVVLLPALAVLSLVINLVLVPRRARARGFAEREDDLVIRSGVLWHQVTAVPYGRLQYVEVSTGPLENLFGLAKLELHTASASTDAKIVGLDRREAARLREALSTRGDQRLAGL